MSTVTTGKFFRRNMIPLVAAAWLLGLAVSPGFAISVSARLLHDTMETAIGSPAIIRPGQEFPTLKVTLEGGSPVDLGGGIVREEDGKMLLEIEPRRLAAGREEQFVFSGTPAAGRYRIQLWFARDGEVLARDAYYFSVFDPDGLPAGQSLIVHPGKDGKLVYIPDYRGNRIPDFSAAGYMAGSADIPEVPVRITLHPQPGDDTRRIQAAIDEVAALPPDREGLRGAVLLSRGVYQIEDTITIAAGGVVLRGEGAGDQSTGPWFDPGTDPGLDGLRQSLAEKPATVLIAVRHAGNLPGIRLRGPYEPGPRATPSEILDLYVPVGAVSFTVAGAGDYRLGESIIVRRTGNRDWIRAIAMDNIPPRPHVHLHAIRQWQPFNHDFERRITSIDGQRITIDAPIFTAIEHRWGGGRIYQRGDSRRLARSGVERLRLIQYPAWRDDEGKMHLRGTAVGVENVDNGWVRNVVAEHFHGAAFSVARSRWISLLDSAALLADPPMVSDGVPSYGFSIAAQEVLVKGCYALKCRHPFVTAGPEAAGVVFLESRGERSSAASQPRYGWSSGGLFDNVEDFLITFMNRLNFSSGHGWAGANHVAWNTRGRLICERSPGAQNWAIGHYGQRMVGAHHGWRPDDNDLYDGGGYGYWELLRGGGDIEVEASGFSWSRAPGSTLDDDPRTYWMVDTRGQWIQYDLGREQEVEALRISFPAFPPPLEDRVYYFDILVSGDGEEWTTVRTGVEGPASGPASFHHYEIGEEQVRFVRIVAQGANMNARGNPDGQAFHMSRFKVVPEPEDDPGGDRAVRLYPSSLYRRQVSDRHGREP